VALHKRLITETVRKTAAVSSRFHPAVTVPSYSGPIMAACPTVWSQPMNRQETINRFLSVSFLYLRLTDKSSEYINTEELEELVEIINADNQPMLCPDQCIA
jgi:hypothetical protein